MSAPSYADISDVLRKRRGSPGVLCMAGLLSVKEIEGVAHASLAIGLDFGSRAPGYEPIRIDDHLLDGHPLRDCFRELAVSDLKPFLERLGQVVGGVYYGADAVVILPAIPRRGDMNSRHDGFPPSGDTGSNHRP